MNHRPAGLAWIVLLGAVLAVAGCSLGRNDAGFGVAAPALSEPGLAGPAGERPLGVETPVPAVSPQIHTTTNVSFRLLDTRSRPLPFAAVRALAAATPTVRFDLLLINAGNSGKPVTGLSKTVTAVASGGSFSATASFTGVPLQTVVAQLTITGGSVGGSPEWRGAKDLVAEDVNVIDLAASGSGALPDLTARILGTLVQDTQFTVFAGPLVSQIEAGLAAKGITADASPAAIVQAMVENRQASPPAVLDLVATAPTPSTLQVTWRTDQPSYGKLRYGSDQSYGKETALATELATSHAVTLTGLQASAAYWIQAFARDARGAVGLSVGRLIRLPPQVLEFPTLVSSMATLLQFRLTNVPATFSAFVTLPTNKGLKTFVRADSISSPTMVVLAYPGFDIFVVDPFRRVSFVPPLPAGAAVEVYDPDKRRSMGTAVVE